MVITLTGNMTFILKRAPEDCLDIMMLLYQWIPIMKIHCYYDNIIFKMEIPIPEKTVFTLRQPHGPFTLFAHYA